MFTSFSIKIKHFKCFGEQEEGFEIIKPVNFLIGKNNSGKSTLLEVISSIVTGEQLNSNTNNHPSYTVSVTLSEEILTKAIDNYARRQNNTAEAWNGTIRGDLQGVIGQKICISPHSDPDSFFVDHKGAFGQYFDTFYQVFVSSYSKKKILRINAERDVKVEYLNPETELNGNGDGATSLIWKYLTDRFRNQNTIKRDFFDQLNFILNPDISFNDISVKMDDLKNRGGSKGEIFFVDANDNSIPLSQMGSGVKTIILTLLNMIVVPIDKYWDKSELIFLFEELENNLHPSLQRRLFHFIFEYAKTYNSIFFITSHAAVPIEQAINEPIAQIVHIDKKGQISKVHHIDSSLGGKNLLRDLGFQASDLLLSNGIIWVEGASDAIYLELLIELHTRTYPSRHKNNYTIQSLATAIWKYAGFIDFDWGQITENLENKIISLPKINHNHLIIIDKDDNYENLPPNEFEQFKHGTGKNKARLINESLKYSGYTSEDLANNTGDSLDGRLLFWVVTHTIEAQLEYFVENKGEIFKDFFTKKNVGFSKKNKGNFSSISKIELASNIAQFALNNNFSIKDFAPPGTELDDKLDRLIKTIQSWN